MCGGLYFCKVAITYDVSNGCNTKHWPDEDIKGHLMRPLNLHATFFKFVTTGNSQKVATIFILAL